MQFIRLQISLVVVLLISITVPAQIRNAYSVGSIGFSGSINPVFSGPVIITGVNCLVLSNGVKTFDLPQAGYFSNTCKFILPHEEGIRLTAFPIPVVNSLTIQSVNQTQMIAEGLIQLQLLDIQGRLINTYYTDSKRLNIGYTISMSQFANGGYYVKAISGNNNFQVLSIIKSN
jgi:hypothetical protein